MRKLSSVLLTLFVSATIGHAQDDSAWTAKKSGWQLIKKRNSGFHGAGIPVEL